MYCTCSNKKKIVVSIEHKPVEVCSKRLGGCGEEIYTYNYSRPISISLNKSMIGKKFRTRSGMTVKLINYSQDSTHPYVFEKDDLCLLTTDSNGSYSMKPEHEYDVVEML